MPESSPPPLPSLFSVARHTRRAEEIAAACVTTDDIGEVHNLATKARQHSSDALAQLELMGARIPAVGSDEIMIEQIPVPQHLLDTPASHRLLTLLEETISAALEVDRERGWVNSCGHSSGLAESCERLVMWMRSDILYGPGGND